MQAANRVLAQLNTPWQKLLSAVADVAGPSVALTGLSPDAQTRTLRIAGVAPALPDIYAYIERLQALPGFTRAHLAQHEVTPAAPPDARVAFTLIANWSETP